MEYLNKPYAQISDQDQFRIAELEKLCKQPHFADKLLNSGKVGFAKSSWYSEKQFKEDR